MEQEAQAQAAGRPDLPKMEEEMIAYWKKKEIFRRSIEERPENKPFVFYDGPPFATGLPHFGHLLQSVIKDAVPRYKTMQGFRVVRRWGWDCHGLPIESLIEKERGLKTRDELCAFGVEKFTESCRTSVFRYVGEWKRYVERIGRWVDMENAYRTLDTSYMESVWWVFAELVKKGFIYKDRRVSLYSPKRATPIANFEVAMDDAYVMHNDPAATVKFRMVGMPKSFFLAWTTTPWTLPANVALAVRSNLMYVTVKITESGEELTFAESRMNEALKQFYPLEDVDASGQHHLMPFEVIRRQLGSDLVGKAYEPLFPARAEGGHRVIAADFVSEEDGTGIVHIAPAYGEEDFNAGKAHELPLVEVLDDQGRFLSDMLDWAGMPYAEANEPILENLAARELLYERKTISHSVPVDPRSGDLLIYRAQSAWFVNIEKLKGKLLETAKRISWHPAHFKEGRFGKGLETSPDWCISRTRFWGAPLPVWECETCPNRMIVSSVKELREHATPESFPEVLDLHRPSIDAVTFACPSCGGVMRRIPEVFDCWFESGSMPYAAEHYPFENRERVERNFPADFIGEAQDQTRGWFRVLHIIATALMGKPAFKDVIVTGMVLNEEGKKMSKREKNYSDPFEVLETYGADALRMYLLASPVTEGEQLNFSERELDETAKKSLTLLWNVARFYKTYEGGERVELAKPRSAHVLDRWIYARLHACIEEVTAAYETYSIKDAVRPLRPFIEDLSTWWLRRSRDRMRGKDAYDRMDALKTLREVLLDFAMLTAPVTPFLADRIYLDLEGMKSSVHLERWPKADARLIDTRLLEDMATVRRAVSVGLERRAAAKIPVRQALAKASIRMRSIADVERLHGKSDLLDLIRDELNVERVTIEAADVSDVDIALDTEITPELKAKGLVREAVRHVMAFRKTLGLKPEDRIALAFAIADADLRGIVIAAKEMIAAQTKADSVRVESADLTGDHQTTVKVDGNEVGIEITKS